MKASEYWASNYRCKRYMAHLSLERLTDRLQYILENLYTIEANGKIGIRDVRVEPWNETIINLAHIYEEFKIRGQTLSHNILDASSIPKSIKDVSDKLLEIAHLAKTKQPHLVKFGRKEYLSKYSFKISLASTFLDPSLNTAQMDDEMKAVYHVNADKVSITTSNGQVIRPTGTVDITYEIDRDYYVFCSSAVFDARLFSNFDADCCLFIYDAQRFTDELLCKFQEHVEIDDYAYRRVDYVDPIKLSKPHIKPSIEFHKHTRYQYQNEYRQVIIPKRNTSKKEHVYLTLDSIKPYTELFYL